MKKLAATVIGLATLIVPITAMSVSSAGAGTTTTVACDEGHWPATVQGQPERLHAGSTDGYYVWHDRYGWHVRTTTPQRSPHVFTGRIVSSDNIRSVTMVRDGHRRKLADGLIAVPSNVGPSTMPSYETLAGQGIFTLSNGIRIFAGQRGDPFYIDLGATFDNSSEAKGLVITSGKEAFIAGADLEMIYAITDPQVVVDMVTQMHALLRGMEKCGRPVVCALNGTALGGGFEIALACHYRIAINNPKTKFGQPEVKLGLLPGGGGTQRIPRLVGMQNSMPILMEGKELRPEQASYLGVKVDGPYKPDHYRY